MAKWTAENIPNLEGRIALITGANSGLGFEASLALAKKHATVVMACRDMAKGQEALQRIKNEVSGAQLIAMELNLASLESIKTFAAKFIQAYDRLDILLNNAGVMAPPYGTTEDGFEMQIGTNHFGHFALTGLLLKRVLSTPHSRVVVVSSFAHHMGRINFDDLNWTHKYSKWPAYGQSKLANLLFTYELDRRFKAADSDSIAVAAHPGYSATHLQRHTGIFSFLNTFLAQSSYMGTLPILYAATVDGVQGAEFYGPDGFMEMRGYPKKASSSKVSYDTALAKRLWTVSEKVTGVRYAFV
jgi:NAD(P)-dependent dehydrogenase (short-subunit alcohol dehydrogenase family)